MKKKLLLFGGGGHCKSVIDSIIALDRYDDIGIVDNETTIGISDISRVGSDNDLPELIDSGWNEGFITVGSIGSTIIRRKLFKLIKQFGLKMPIIIDPTAILANGIFIDEGSFIGKGSVVNTGSKIGCCAIINSGSIIEHECIIDEFSHVSSGATLCGKVSIGSDTHIGAGSVIKQGISIGNKSLIGIGSVVTKNIPDNVMAYGNPCRWLNK